MLKGMPLRTYRRKGNERFLYRQRRVSQPSSVEYHSRVGLQAGKLAILTGEADEIGRRLYVICSHNCQCPPKVGRRCFSLEGKCVSGFEGSSNVSAFSASRWSSIHLSNRFYLHCLPRPHRTRRKTTVLRQSRNRLWLIHSLKGMKRPSVPISLERCQKRGWSTYLSQSS